MNKLEIFTIILVACAAINYAYANNLQGNAVPITNVNIKSVETRGSFLGFINFHFNSEY